MADRARHTEVWAQRQQEAVDALAVVEDQINDEDSVNNEELEKTPVRVPQRKERVLRWRLCWRWIQRCDYIW